MDVRVGLWRKLSTEKWMLLNCGIGEDSWEFLGTKEIQPVHPKRDQSWVFIGRTDVEAETPILWPPHEKSWLIGKDPDAGRDWGQEEKGMTEDQMAGWLWVWVNSGSWWCTGRPGVLWFMGSQSDMTERLNWTDGRCDDLQLLSQKCDRASHSLFLPLSLPFPFPFSLPASFRLFLPPSLSLPTWSWNPAAKFWGSPRNAQEKFKKTYMWIF